MLGNFERERYKRDAASDLAADAQELAEADEPSPFATPTRRSFFGVAGQAVGALGVMGLGAKSFELIHRAVPTVAATPRATPSVVRPPHFATLSPADAREWQIFKRRFLLADGRIVDTGNNSESHTEGQGWGMLFAVDFDDRDTFTRIYDWTERTLSRPSDSLHSWRYQPGSPNPVSDPNNATDGDIFIAWALWRAAYRWGEPRYAEAAHRMADDILGLLVRRAGPRTVLLPGANGFTSSDSIEVNPSYYAFEALEELSQASPSPVWDALERDGVAMLSEGRFGRWRLPPDWLSVSRRDGSLQPAPGRPVRFSYDAIRVPLYMSWAHVLPNDLDRSFASYADSGTMPAWVDLRSGATAPYAASPGMRAIAQVSTDHGDAPLPQGFPSLHTAATDYYSGALTLLSRVAWREMHTPPTSQVMS
ncbi:MAG: hypothetical protein JO264_02270 [Acidisphaera sp.]|nr:hypothetical protein [Acidisphaera sp.]